MKPISIGVLGLGQMGQIHARNIAALPGARLHAVASRRPDMAEAVARRHGARPYAGYDQFFADAELDAVIIATSCEEHPPHVVQAARRGLHIFCEKPIAFDPQLVEEALVAVAQAGVHFQVGFMRRYDPGYAAAHAEIVGGSIGRPLLFRATSRDPFWPDKQDKSAVNTLLLDLGVHDFDLARWLMGSEVEEVYAVGGAMVYPELAGVHDADNAVISLRFASGGIGTVDFSRNARYGYDIRAEVVGDEGAVMVGRLQQKPFLFLSRGGVTHDVYPWYAERFGEAFHAEMAAFVDALQHGRAPLPGPEDGRRATQIGVAAADSMASGRPVRLVA